MIDLSSLLASFRRAKIRRTSIRALHGLSAEQLADIGIATDEIGDAVDALMVREPISAARKKTASAISDLRGLGVAG